MGCHPVLTRQLVNIGGIRRVSDNLTRTVIFHHDEEDVFLFCLCRLLRCAGACRQEQGWQQRANEE